MKLETKKDAEKFLWSCCVGGYDNYNGSEHHKRIYGIRMILKNHVDKDKYGTTCRAMCRDNTPCMQMVKVYRKRCYHHVRLK